MTRAPSATKPDPHQCCFHASHLRPRSLSGRWAWVCHFGGMALPVTHCAWCGTKLPSRKTPSIRLLKGGGR